MSIEFKDVSYTYQKGTPFEFEAIRNINLKMHEGQYYALVGQTGSGKSTLIQHLNGLIKPTSGTMINDNIEVTHKTKDKILRQLRKKVGVVFQFPESQLFEDTVQRELEFGPKNFDMDVKKCVDDAYKLLQNLGFPRDVLTLSPFQMSGGQMRKLAIVSILAMQPKVLVLDEPTAGLDPKSRIQVMELIKSLQLEKKITVILVTHDMNDVAQYADEVIVMNKGEIVKQADPRVIFSDEEGLSKWHMTLPDVVKLQKDIERKYSMTFEQVALNEEEFVNMYKEWQQS